MRATGSWPAAPRGWRRRSTSRGVPHDVKEYPAAGHSFLNDEANAPWYLAPMSWLVLHAGPEPASAEDAWGRIEVFLEQHLTS